MNRRAFLASAGPLLLGMTHKAAQKYPTVGTAGHTYECVHNWGALPPDYKWQTTHNVALDSSGMVYITHQGVGNKMDTVLVFDPHGKFVRSFGKEWHGGGHGIEIRKDGGEEFCYLTNSFTTTDMKVVKTTLKGDLVWKMSTPDIPEYTTKKNRGYKPTNITFLPDGGFNVGDGYGSHYLLNYDKDAKLVKVFGGTGAGDGQLDTPHGQWYDDRNKHHPMIVVCDRANGRLCRFTPEGKFVDATKKGEVVLFPAHAKTRGDVLMVADLHARVSLFDKDNKPLVHLGDDEAWRKTVLTTNVRADEKRWRAGKFVHPHDAAFDKDGNIFVVEWVTTGRVTLLKKV